MYFPIGNGDFPASYVSLLEGSFLFQRRLRSGIQMSLVTRCPLAASQGHHAWQVGPNKCGRENRWFVFFGVQLKILNLLLLENWSRKPNPSNLKGAFFVGFSQKNPTIYEGVVSCQTRFWKPELCSLHRGIMYRFPIWSRVTLRDLKLKNLSYGQCQGMFDICVCYVYWSLNQSMHKGQMSLMSLKTGVNTMKCSEDLKHFMSLQKHAHEKNASTASRFETPFFQPPAIFSSVRSCAFMRCLWW